MKIAGSNTIPFPVDQVWDALLDPAVLVRTLPGCERLVARDEHHYDMTVTAGVAAIRGTYDGTCALSDLVQHESLTMRLQGAGAPGTVDATVDVRFEPGGDVTTVRWDADAVVGGMVGGVGQRMLGSVSTRMAGECFGNVSDALSGATPSARPGSTVEPVGRRPEPVEGTPTGQRVFTAPPRAAGGRDEFLKGVALGAGLVLLGVVAGGIFGRRRS
jgi:carbon monoxide dehydrogenase subunit G